jgi:hypothetical protein
MLFQVLLNSQFFPRYSDLSHGSEETLWVEESRHPERYWSPVEAPRVELVISLYQLRKPETYCTGIP